MGKATGKYAFGICDRTGFRYPINELVYEFDNGKRTGLRVGRDVADRDAKIGPIFAQVGTVSITTS